MNRGTFFPLFLGLLLFAFKPAGATDLKAFFSHAEFYAPGKGPYLETYLSFIGSSLTPMPQSGQQFAEVEVTIIIRNGDEVANYSKYRVKSPLVSDSLIIPNFIDQQRFILPNGSYVLELTLLDVHHPTQEKFAYEETIQIDFQYSGLSFSDIQLIETFTPTVKANILSKSGFDMIPYVSDFYPQSMQKLIFYHEIYNAETTLGKGEKFLVTYYLQNSSSKEKVENYSNFARKDAAPVVITFGEFPIANLPSGTYELVIEARDKTNNLLGRTSSHFQRSNPASITVANLADAKISPDFGALLPADSLDMMLEAIHPIATPAEQQYIRNQLRSDDQQLKMSFLYQFWTARSPENPAAAFIQHGKRVEEANTAFTVPGTPGYLTDQGRVYLQYGAPSSITERRLEANAYPYVIWHYYKIGNYTNRKFIFYNRNSAYDDWQLLHSDMFGEINNPRWQSELQRRNTTNRDPYEDHLRESIGTESPDDLFNRPR